MREISNSMELVSESSCDAEMELSAASSSSWTLVSLKGLNDYVPRYRHGRASGLLW